MNLKQTATIVIGGGVFAAWLAGAATQNRAVLRPAPTRPKAIDQSGAALAAEAARLHERLRPDVAPRSPGRNLFTFGRTPSHAPAASSPRSPLPEAPPPPPIISLPPLRLSGIAEDPGPDGPKRIAFIAGDGQLHIVKEGDTLLARYRVTKISSEAVELTDIDDGSVRRLALR